MAKFLTRVTFSSGSMFFLNLFLETFLNTKNDSPELSMELSPSQSKKTMKEKLHCIGHLEMATWKLSLIDIEKETFFSGSTFLINLFLETFLNTKNHSPELSMDLSEEHLHLKTNKIFV